MAHADAAVQKSIDSPMGLQECSVKTQKKKSSLTIESPSIISLYVLLKNIGNLSEWNKLSGFDRQLVRRTWETQVWKLDRVETWRILDVVRFFKKKVDGPSWKDATD